MRTTVVFLFNFLIGLSFIAEAKTINKENLLKELESGRALAKSQCFRLPPKGAELKNAEWCGAYQTLDVLIHDINKGNIK